MTTESRIITDSLGPAHLEENVCVLKYGPDLVSELEGLAKSKHLFDTVIINVTEVGFFFNAELIVEASGLARNLLALQGAMLFLKSDKAMALVRESLMGPLTFHIFESHSEIFDHSPSLSKHVQRAMGQAASTLEESTDLSKQVLMSSVPVLTALGMKLKGEMDRPGLRNRVIAVVDNYSPLSTLISRMCADGHLREEDLFDQLKSLEQAGVIYPIFAKIPFLVNSFKNKTAFSLKDYFKESRIIPGPQIDQVLLELQNMPKSKRLNFGAMCVKGGLINARMLEIAIQDQAFYGQSSQEERKVGKAQVPDQDAQVQAMMGHLGTTDPSNLLQNIATNRDTGVLSVEYRDQHFRALFDVGKLTHAKLGKVTGNRAVVEFASSWKEGIYVFIHRTPPQDLNRDDCKLTRLVDKLLLDAALAQDNTEVTWKKVPKGKDSVLEKVSDSKRILSGEVIDPQEKKPIPAHEVAIMQRMWNSLDGLASIAVVIRNCGDMTTYEAAQAIDRLLHYKLVVVPTSDITAPLEKYNLMVRRVTERIGVERNLAFLRIALKESVGFGKARSFEMGSQGEIGVNLAAARQAGTSLTQLVKDLENWQVKYIEYVSQELERGIILSIIKEAHQAK